ncbi:hypothetical protein V1290_002548 [Bradyrhizobium sp. AZCC 1578]
MIDIQKVNDTDNCPDPKTKASANSCMPRGSVDVATPRESGIAHQAGRTSAFRINGWSASYNRRPCARSRGPLFSQPGSIGRTTRQGKGGERRIRGKINKVPFAKPARHGPTGGPYRPYKKFGKSAFPLPV